MAYALFNFALFCEQGKRWQPHNPLLPARHQGGSEVEVLCRRRRMGISQSRPLRLPLHLASQDPRPAQEEGGFRGPPGQGELNAYLLLLKK